MKMKVKRKRPEPKLRSRPKRIRGKIDFADDVLVGKSKNRSRKAFTTLYERHHTKMRNTAYGLCRDDIDAEDICQMAWVRAWRMIRKFRNDCAFGTWMTVIVRNVFLDERRKKNRSHTDSLEQFQADADRPDPTHCIVDPGILPDQRIQKIDTARFVREMVRLMPEPHRTVLRLHFFEDLHHDQIAKRMGTPLGTSLSRLSYGKIMLRKIVERNLNGAWHDVLL